MVGSCDNVCASSALYLLTRYTAQFYWLTATILYRTAFGATVQIVSTSWADSTVVPGEMCDCSLLHLAPLFLRTRISLDIHVSTTGTNKPYFRHK